MRFLAASLACYLLAACSSVEMTRGEQSHARREIPPGPGVLTGETGTFVLYRQGENAETRDSEGQSEGQEP
ncbi:MAG: hypothetical protein ACR2QJ_06375 [Geminicoccaceae bacterium]